MTEVTIDPKAASEALGVTTWDLAQVLRKAAVSRMEYIAQTIRDPARSRDSRLGYFDEMTEEVRKLLAAAEACDSDWWDDINGGESDDDPA